MIISLKFKNQIYKGVISFIFTFVRHLGHFNLTALFFFSLNLSMHSLQKQCPHFKCSILTFESSVVL